MVILIEPRTIDWDALQAENETEVRILKRTPSLKYLINIRH